MGVFYKFIIVTSGVSIFAGTAYITAISLAPPPTYTVSNHQRLQRYDALAVNNVYEKKTKGQEFYLGLTRWRRTLLRDEHVLRGRVLEVGAGCGTNVPYYCQHFLTEDSTVQSFMSRLYNEMHTYEQRTNNVTNNKTEQEKEESNSTSKKEQVHVNELLTHLSKYNSCDEIILCDRAPNMVEACVRKVQSRFGYVPYRYPDYDVTHIVEAIQKDHHDREVLHSDTTTSQINQNGNNNSNTIKSVTVKRKVMRGDGTVSEVITVEDTNTKEKEFETIARDHENRNGSELKSVAPIITNKALVEMERMRLLSPDRLKELQQRECIVAERQQLHQQLLQFLKIKRDDDKLQRAAALQQYKEESTKANNESKTNTDSISSNNKTNNNNCYEESDLLNRNITEDSEKEESSSSWLHKLVPHKLYAVSEGISVIMHRQEHENKYKTTSKSYVKNNDICTSKDNGVDIAKQAEVLQRAWEHQADHPQPLFAVANYAAEQLPFPDNSFDTVVDMFGLCSYDDPVQALQELSRVCKPNGKLLLIEHGKGHTRRVNDHLDKWAPRHAKNWGCWWNRDIRRVIRLSGVVPEKWQNKHFGTSHYIIAKPYKTMQEWDEFFKHPH